MAMPQTRQAVALDDPHVWQELTRVARAALNGAGDDVDVARAIRTTVQAGEGLPRRYDVRAQPLLHASDEKRTVIVIAVESTGAGAVRPEPQDEEEEAAVEATALPAARDLPAPDEVAARFDLTPRQAEVAVLLARRLSTKEIASRLGISRHTARRHVEAVLCRLGVHRRTAVAGVIRKGRQRRRVARLA